MLLWIRQGRQSIRWNGYQMFGCPPVLAPPAWARTERVWETIGETRFASAASSGLLRPDDWFETLIDALPGSGIRRLCLVVPDGTRVGAWQSVLPRLLRDLRSIGRSRPCLLVASGTHAPLGQEELHAHLLARASAEGAPGPEDLLEGWDVIQNSENGFTDHRDVGTTEAGTPVRLHPEYLDADCRILLGEISYHYFAGFGGGPKLVFPGLGEPIGAGLNHRRAVRGLGEGRPWGELEWEERCGPALLEDHGNPVRIDLAEAAALAPPSWVITAVDHPDPDPDPARPVPTPVEIIQGVYPLAIGQAVEHYESIHRVALTKSPDLLLCDAGGAPRDDTFLQAHKSLQHGARFLAPGGRLLLAASCHAGLGSATIERFAADPEHFAEHALGGLDPMLGLHLQTLFALRSVVGQARVGLWSSLPAAMVRALGMEPLEDETAARDWCLAETSNPFWGWLPRAERFLPCEGWLGGDRR